MNDLIFASLENWDDIWRRNQFVCAQLARRHPKMKILFVALPKDVSNRVRRRDLSDLGGQSTYTVPRYENITVTHAHKFLPNSLAWGRRMNQSLTSRKSRP